MFSVAGKSARMLSRIGSHSDETVANLSGGLQNHDKPMELKREFEMAQRQRNCKVANTAKTLTSSKNRTPHPERRPQILPMEAETAIAVQSSV
jgi:hypothetical protein